MDMLRKWAFGYCAARGYAAPVAAALPGALWFDVGKSDQVGRLVIGDTAPDALAAAFAHVDAPHIFVEIAAPHAAVAPHIPPGWQLRTPAWLMIAGPPGAAPPEPAGFAFELFAGARHCEAVARDTGGAVAARGIVGLDGAAAVYDQIATEPAYGRRGLGSAIMARLIDAAATRGATDHLLIATADGRALYQRLGWRVVSDIVSVISPDGRRAS